MPPRSLPAMATGVAGCGASPLPPPTSSTSRTHLPTGPGRPASSWRQGLVPAVPPLWLAVVGLLTPGLRLSGALPAAEPRPSHASSSRVGCGAIGNGFRPPLARSVLWSVCGGASGGARCQLPRPMGAALLPVVWAWPTLLSASSNPVPVALGIVRNLARAKALLGSPVLAAATPAGAVSFLEVPPWPLLRAPTRVSGETLDLVH